MFSIEPGGEVVEDVDLVTPGEERLREVAAHEPGAARDQRLHSSMSSRIVSSAWIGRAARRPITRWASRGG